MWRVLVVEDSETVKAVLLDIFARDRNFRVSATCDSGMQATRLAAALKPDLITLDLVLPDIDGIQAIRNIMAHSPTRILVVSSRAKDRNSPLAIDALHAGALDVVAKNSLAEHRDQFLHKARGICEAPLPNRIGASAAAPLGQPMTRSVGNTKEIDLSALGLGPLPPRVIVIGASTGGPAAIERLLKLWPKTFPLPVVIAQHMTDGFSRELVGWLQSRTEMIVQTAADGEQLRAGHVYFAPDGHHIKVTQGGNIGLDKASDDSLNCPSVDILFDSAIHAFGRATLAVLLTGMGEDGARSLKSLRDAGARTVAQDKATSLVFGMPQAAIKLEAARIVLSLDEIAHYLLDRSARVPA